MKKYDTAKDTSYYKPSHELINFFSGNKTCLNMQAIEEQVNLRKHRLNEQGMDAVYEKADALIKRLGPVKVLSFASREQIALMYALQQETSTDYVASTAQLYISRLEKSEPAQIINRYLPGSDIAFIIKPLLDQLQVMLAFGQKMQDPLATKLKDMGNIGDRLHAVYQAQQTLLEPPWNLSDYKNQSIASLVEGLFNGALWKQASTSVTPLLSDLKAFIEQEVINSK